MVLTAILLVAGVALSADAETGAGETEAVEAYRAGRLQEDWLSSYGLSYGGGATYMSNVGSSMIMRQGRRRVRPIELATLGGDVELAEQIRRQKKRTNAILWGAAGVSALIVVPGLKDGPTSTGVKILGVVGAVNLCVTVPLVAFRKTYTRNSLGTWFTRERLGEIKHEHNTALRQSLGLSEDEVQGL